jgi:peptide chain release factor 1
LDELEALLQDSDTDDELRTLAQQDLEASSQSLRDAAASLTNSLVPKDPYAHLPCMVEIRPGVGGREAAIFTGDLLRMYTAYCMNTGLRMVLLQRDAGDAPEEVVEAVFEVDSAGAYGLLRCEAGVHRVQRVPATEAKGRLHTSTASVMILPRAPQDDADAADMAVDNPASDFYIDAKEVERQYLRASGAGGQHVNKTESKVRLTHAPTGTTVAIQESRSRQDNEKRAWALLRAKLALMRRERREAETTALRRSVIGVARTGRADKVRTYNWQQQRVTDHRCGITVHGIDGILEGGVNLARLMDGVRKWQAEVDVENLIADTKVATRSS